MSLTNERNYFFQIVNHADSRRMMISLEKHNHPFLTTDSHHALDEVAVAAVEKFSVSLGGLESWPAGQVLEVHIWNGVGAFIGSQQVEVSHAPRLIARPGDEPMAINDLSEKDFSEFGSWPAYLMNLADLRIKNDELTDRTLSLESENQKLQAQLEEMALKLDLFRMAEQSKEAAVAHLGQLRQQQGGQAKASGA